MRPPDRVPSPDIEYDKDASERKRPHRTERGAESEWNLGDDGYDALGEEPSAKKAKANHAHSDSDSKSEFRSNGLPEFHRGNGGGGGGGDADFVSNKEYIPLEELDERLMAYEQIPEKDRWCPMCAITAKSNALKSSSMSNKVTIDSIIRDIDATVENGMLNNWKLWAMAVKMKWDVYIRPTITKPEPVYGIRKAWPEWYIDTILYHYLRETVSERRIEASQIRDMYVMMTTIKKEIREKKPDGSKPMNLKAVAVWLALSKELRSRLKEFKGSR